jgi:hypothetical protein
MSCMSSACSLLLAEADAPAEALAVDVFPPAGAVAVEALVREAMTVVHSALAPLGGAVPPRVSVKSTSMCRWIPANGFAHRSVGACPGAGKDVQCARTMSVISWIPLDLWRASKLEVETRQVQAAWAQAQREGDEEVLRALKASIEDRIDDLENFYVRNTADQRAVLFEKQRLTLRALLSSYGAGPRGASSSPAKAASPVSRTVSPGAAHRGAAAASSSAPSSDDSRIDQTALERWLSTDGRRQVPGFPSKHLGSIFREVSEASEHHDDKVSLKEVRHWFFNVYRRGGWKPADPESASKTPSSARRQRLPLYEFETRAMGESRGTEASPSPARHHDDEDNGGAPDSFVGLPGSSLVFEVELTAEEMSALNLRKRGMEAERRFKERCELAKRLEEQARQDNIARGGLFTPELSRDSLLKDSAFVDSEKLEKFIFRSANTSSWVAEKDFKTR